MSSDASNPKTNLDEQLVAYLDGELDVDGRRRIEGLLASDPQVRRRMQSLEQTWEMLDELDAAPVSKPLTQTTLEMVALAASNEAQEAIHAGRSRRWLILLGIVAAAVIGYVGVVWFTPDPNQQLVNDLPIMQYLDEYRQVESVDFLRKLNEKGMFQTPRREQRPDELGIADSALPSTTKQLTTAVERMPVAEKERLVRFSDRFARLPTEEQQRLRQLHAALQADANQQRLQLVMENYYAWLQTLSGYRRAELLDMKPADRVAAVEKRLKEEKRQEGGGSLSDKDGDALVAFLQQFAVRHDNEFLAQQPDPKQRERLTKLGPGLRHLAFFRDVWQPWLATGGKTPPPMMTDADWSKLKAALSDEARDRLETMPPAEQWRTLADWSHHAMQARMLGRGGRGPTPDEDQRLADFFENGLSDEERDRLLAMPSEEMLRQLQRLFWNHAKPTNPPGHRPQSRRVPQ